MKKRIRGTFLPVLGLGLWLGLGAAAGRRRLTRWRTCRAEAAGADHRRHAGQAIPDGSGRGDALQKSGRRRRADKLLY